MKKMFSVLLAAALIVSALPMAFAAVIDGGECGVLSWTLDDAGTLTINGTGEMDDFYESFFWSWPSSAPWLREESNVQCIKTVVIKNGVTSIGDMAFRSCLGLTSVTIPDSVTSIGDSAFSGCAGLTSVTIPDSVTSIGDSAFYYCTGLTSVTIPNGVTSIGEYAFKNCKGLTSVTIPGSVTTIEFQTFYGCKGLVSATIGNGVSNIELSAFAYCTGLTSVTIPGSVTCIGDSAFQSCTELESVTVGNGVKSIGEDAFIGCTGLKQVTIPGSVTNIGEQAFYNCTRLTKVNIESLPSWCKITFSDGASNPLAYAHHLYLNDSEITDLLIPDSVTTIGDHAFYGCSGLKSVMIPDSVTRIGSFAFHGCSGLKSVMIPDSVKSIEDYTFSHCSGLTSVTIPDSVTSIGYMAFKVCTGLTSVTIPDSVTSIGEDAFGGCSGLKSVTIGNGVTNIGNSAFAHCTGLTKVNIDSLLSWCRIEFGWSANPLYYAHHLYLKGSEVTDLIIPDSVTRIGSYAFNGCEGLTSVTIPDSATSIGQSAFEDCSGLTKVNIDSLSSWCNIEFGNLYSNPLSFVHHLYLNGSEVADLIIPDSVTNIGDFTFYGYSGLTSVKIPDSVTSIGRYAFSGCTGLTSVRIPDSVTSIGRSAFAYCTGLTSVTVGKSATDIGRSAFYSCRALSSITLPGCMNHIEQQAFQGCESLRDVYFNGTESQWSNIIIESDNTCLTNAVIHFQTGGDNAKNRCGDNAFWSFEPDSNTLRIHGSGAMQSYDSKQAPWADDAHWLQIQTVLVEDGITSVGAGAFYGLPNLKRAQISDTVQVVGAGAFANSCLAEVTLPAGLLTIEDAAFNKTQLTHIVLPTGLQTVGASAFAYTHLTGISIPASVHTISDNAFLNCIDITTVRYGGTEKQWKSIEIGPGNEALQKAKILYNRGSAFGKPKDAECLLTLNDDNGSVHVSLHQDWFGAAYSNQTYHHDLAKFCAAFSMLGYSGKKTAEDLRDCGFEVLDINMNAGRDQMNTFVAAKTITVDGKRKNLIFVGTIGSHKEQWFSDFDPYGRDRKINYAGNEELGFTHLGFADAREYAYGMLAQAIADNYLDTAPENNILLFTGHSRGAATANILAAKVIDEAKWASPDSIYAYTFATPNSTRAGNVHDAAYNSIFNIVNPEDFVTKVMLRKPWGYDRYGVTYVLPSKTNTKGAEYNRILKKMKDVFATVSGGWVNDTPYKPFPGGEAETWAAIKLMGINIPTVDDFYEKVFLGLQALYIRTAYDLFNATLLKVTANISPEEVALGVATALAVRTTGNPFFQALLAYFFDLNVKLDYSGVQLSFAQAHQAETYCAYMYTLTEQELKDDKESFIGAINCPVDVEIVEKETGEVVGRIKDNTVDETVAKKENAVVMIVQGDEKTFWLPSDVSYDVRLIGNDDGTMDMTLQQVDADAGELSRAIFCQVPVTQGEAYVCSVSDDLAPADCLLVKKDGSVRAPDEAFSAEEEPQYTVTVNSEDGGSAHGSGIYTVGDYAEVTALPDETHELLGWFIGEEKISDLPVYRFRVEKDVSLTALFQPCPEKVPCDVNDDGKLTPEDARLALRCSVHLEDYTVGSAQYLACDADGDGTVTSGDARLILRVSVKLDDISLLKQNKVGDCKTVIDDASK